MQKLIIFDLDGVIINSEKIYREMNLRFFDQLGVSITPDEYESFIGISASLMWTYIKQKGKLLQSVDELKATERELKFKTLSETVLEPMNGLQDFLHYFRSKNIPIAIASSGMRKNIELIISKINFSHLFDFIISGEEVVNGKPDPEIFLKAATKFNAKPRNCIVTEDSKNGARAAKAADMYCIGFVNPDSGNQDLSISDFLTTNFHDNKLYDFIDSTFNI